MKKIGIIVAVIIVALIGGGITVKSLERVGQGEVGVVYSIQYLSSSLFYLIMQQISMKKS